MYFVRLRRRLPRYLFLGCLAVAVALVVVVVAAPLFDGEGSGRLLALFARDTVVRRTTLAGALGLVATGFIFFRPPYGRPPRSPTDVIGA